jgi:LysM repeat protein
MSLIKKCIVLFCLTFLVSVSTVCAEDFFTHLVKRGETLYSISNLYKVSIASIEALNPNSKESIREGETLRIPQVKKGTEKPRYHTIALGETLYKLTKMYNVSAKAICDTNPGLSFDNFKAGQVIVIPSIDESTEQPKPQAEQNTSAKPKCKDMHKVKRRETIYSIAKDNHITIEELKEANPELKLPDYKLEKGHFLCIPFPKPEQPKEITEDVKLFPATKPSSGLQHIRMGVVLPMESGNNESKRMLEFYQGLLMAVDSLKQVGISSDVYAFEAGTTEESIQKVITEPGMKNLDIIFGPLYSAQTKTMGEFARKNQTLLVLPFTNRTTEVYGNPYIYQINAPQSYQYAQIYGYFSEYFQKANIILFADYSDTKSQEAEFIIGLKKALTERGIPYEIMTPQASEEQMSQILSRDKENVIVPTASGISTLNVLMPKLKEFQRAHSNYPLHLFGYPAWQTFTSVHLDNFYDMDTYVFSSFYRNPISMQGWVFDRKFRSNFHHDMIQCYPRFAMLGFDVGYYFLRNLSTNGKEGFNNGIKTTKVTPLQNGISLQRVSNWGGYINTQMKLIHYTRNNSIETINIE